MTSAQRAVIATIAIALCSVIAWTQAQAWVFFFDKRAISRSDMVGRISFDLPEGRSTGTAFFVSGCEILTSFHVVFGPWTVTALRPPSSAQRGRFELEGVTLADGSHPAAEAIPVAWGDYTGPDRQFRKGGEDWVLLTLDDCLGYVHGYYVLVDPALDDAADAWQGVMGIGYSSGRQMTDPRCSIRRDPHRPDIGAVLHDCATLQGDSGGPIVLRGTGRVVAITSGVKAGDSGCRPGHGDLLPRWSGDCTNTAVPLSHRIIRRIDQTVAALDAQRVLLQSGYNAGQPGLINQPVLAAAIRQAQRDVGFAASGETSYAFTTVLWIRRSGFGHRAFGGQGQQRNTP
jgi:hypothetical protein